MYTKSILSFIAIATLSACGGSSTGPASFTTASSQAAFDATSQKGLALIEQYGDAAATTEMPVSGTANYFGVAGFSDVPDVSPENIFTVADVAITASFNATGGSINGSMTNFLDSDPDNGQVQAIGGSLGISDGVITGNSFTASVSGTLTAGNDKVEISGGMNGEFVGDNAAALRAGIDIVDSVANERFYGALIAEKQ